MVFVIECMYCGHRWEKQLYSESALSSVICPKCRDSFLKAKPLKDYKLDTYIGCPSFPLKKLPEEAKEEKKDEEDPLLDFYSNFSY